MGPLFDSAILSLVSQNVAGFNFRKIQSFANEDHVKQYDLYQLFNLLVILSGSVDKD